MVRLHRVCVTMHVPVAQILTRDRRFLFQNYGNPKPNTTFLNLTCGNAQGGAKAMCEDIAQRYKAGR